MGGFSTAGLWTFVPFLAGIYCLYQAVRDYRRRDYVMAACGAACMFLLWAMPIPSHAVKIDLPIRSSP